MLPTRAGSRHFRGHSRPRRAVEVRYRPVDAAGEERTAMTTNIGNAGAFIVTEERLAVGTRLEVRLELPQRGPTTVRAEVIRHSGEHEETRGLGLRFTDLSGDTLMALDEYFAALADPDEGEAGDGLDDPA